MKYCNALTSPIEVRGLLANYRRLPEDIIDKVNEGVTDLAKDTAGGRIRFATNSSQLEVKVKLRHGLLFNHMPLSGTSSVDCYFDGRYIGIYRPDDGNQTEYSGIVYLPCDGKFHQIELNLPLYNGVDSVEIGITDEAELAAPRAYRYDKPVVFYGSSITQGGCASRPGLCYTSIVARRLDCDHINLGFSGSARGEQIVADYIASLDMTAFVLDYDHNAPSAEHLRNTHANFFRTVRSAHPELPIVIVTKPDFDNDRAGNTERRAVVMRTYLEAFESGDRNVYFCDGKSMFTGMDRDSCTVDTCHPNDLGFNRMADAVMHELDFLKF